MNRLPLPLIAAMEREPKALRTISEKVFQQAVIDYAVSKLWLVFFTYRSVHSPCGEPDLRMVNRYQKRVCWTELKAENGRPTHEQLVALEWLTEAGQEAGLFRPRDAKRLMAILDGRERIT